MRRWLAALALFGVAAPGVALPPYTAAYEPTTVDERGLWMDADNYERRLRDSPLTIRDEALNAYARRVLCATVGDDRCRAVRIYIVEAPAMNASMAPNGTMQVNSGLLLRARSEAELAAVLGHEFAHFELRHSVAGFKQQRGTGDLVAWIGVLGGLSGTAVGSTQLLLTGSIYRFNREQESAADTLGLQYLQRSPYPAMAASELWRHLTAEDDATMAGRKLRSTQRYGAGFFATHPTNLKRATTLAAAAQAMNDPGDPGVASHRAAIAPHLPRFLNAQVSLNDFGGSDYLLGQLAASSGWSGDLLYARGELHRRRGEPRDLVSASQFYGDALKAGHSTPEVHRDLGLSLLRSGQATVAKQSLGEYLRLKPDASDAKAIAALLAN